MPPKTFALAQEMFYSCGMSHAMNGNGNGHDAYNLLRQVKKKAVLAKADPKTNAIKESVVTFHNAEKSMFSGTPIRFARHAMVFEMYGGSGALRASEVLEGFQICIQGKLIYSGRAVIRNILNAGTKTICETTLNESHWTDMNWVKHGAPFAEEFKTFIQEWQKLYKVLPEFKVVVADMQTLLQGLRLWLDRVELGLQTLPADEREASERQVMKEAGQLFVPVFDVLHEKMEAISGQIGEDLRPAHRVFAQRQLHPLMLCSPFARRAYEKPLGYAGDYEMVNMIALDPYQGESLFAKIVNLWFLSQWPSKAHRNRLTYLKKRLENETLRVCRKHRKARIFNFACGPALEVQHFLAESPVSNQAELTLADFNQETLDHLACTTRNIKEKFALGTLVRFQRKNVLQVIKESQRRSAEKPKYDYIYCAGLFDYLPDSTCSQLMEIFYDWLAPDGLLAVTNVVDDKPFRHMLEFVLDWNLIYRNVEDGSSIMPTSIPQDARSIKKDPTGVNIFIEARKPSEQHRI
jgi:extracellular factor (EF) 3-hydroxypalmitic acid methyl ester biosynthesis protein